MTRILIRLTSLLTVATLISCATVESIAPDSTGARLYDGLDRYHRPITTTSDDAQRWFDQGLQLVFGFNHDEAVRSFKEAAARDPEAAMPWWGVALCLGMNINDPVITEERWRDAHAAAQRALALIDDETALERALVEAVAKRYTWPAPEEQKTYDEAYAAAMKPVYEEHSDDSDIGVLYAESLMDLQPWDYWDNHRDPKGNTLEFVGVIEKVLAAHPDHPGASHLYIHAMEAGPSPEKAVPYADRLRTRIPGAGHLVHMPSHIYARVGRYGDAADSNVEAVAADRAYLKEAPKPGIYTVYYAHNQHFLAFASMMEGRFEPAMQAARDLEKDMPDDVLREFAFLIEGIMPTNYHVLIRFGKWNEVLEEALPAEHRLVTRAVHYYARGIANSALGRTEEAKAEIAHFEEAVAKVPEDWWVFNNKMHDVLPIARAMLAGELAFREGRLDDAWSALRQGIEAEDRLIYDEPPGWMLPVRHAMGALLMSAGEHAEAERLYREDQERHPGNVWSLVGLQQSLAAQRRSNEANALEERLAKVTTRLTARPSSSCLCEPGEAASAQVSKLPADP